MLLTAPALAQTVDTKISIVAKSEAWRRLLHFDKNSSKSEIVQDGFFISPKGSVSPELELSASIQALKNEFGTVSEDNQFACRFPARKRFIEEQFSIKSKQKCTTFQAWQQRAQPDEISFVYTSQFVGNPASAFGHSFLRFDRQARSGLLGYSLSYFAQIDDSDSSLTYAIKGLTGGYRGVYQFDNYYLKTHGYASVENRDMWEYKLKLTGIEKQKIFEHAWELSLAGGTKYFFLDRNCTYQLLKLLDVANVDFELSKLADQFFITPQDSVKILNSAGLILKTEYRPSLRQKALSYYDQIDQRQKDLLTEVLDQKRSPEELTNPLASSALVATLAMNELTDANRTQSSLFTRALEARSRLPASSPMYLLKAESSKWNPVDSHGTMQANLGFVSHKGDTALQLGFRPALHTLDQLSVGFLPNTQLVFLDTSLRVNSDHDIRLYELNLIDIKSLQPVSVVNSSSSWAAKLAIAPVLGSGCDDCHQIRTSFLWGYSADLIRRTTGFALVGPTVDVLQPKSTIGARIGPTVAAGFLTRGLKNFVMKVEERGDHFVSGPFQSETLLTSEASMTWQASKNSSATLRALQIQNINESKKSMGEFGLHFAQSF